MVIYLKPGESYRGGKVVKEEEYQKEQRLKEGARLIKQQQEANKPKVTSSKIVVDETGKQVGLVQTRTPTQVEVTDYRTRVPTKQTIRGIPEFVKQEQTRIVKERFPTLAPEGSVNYPEGKVNFPPTKEGQVSFPPTKNQYQTFQEYNAFTVRGNKSQTKKESFIQLRSKEEIFDIITGRGFEKANPDVAVFGIGGTVGLLGGKGAIGALPKVVKSSTKLIGGFALGQGIYQGTLATEKTARTKEQKANIKQLEEVGIDYNKAINAALLAESQTVSGIKKQEGIYNREILLGEKIFDKPVSFTPRSILYEIPAGQLIAGSKQSFTKAFKQNLQEQGLNPEQAEYFTTVGLRERKARATGEGLSALSFSATAERLGSGFLSKSFLKQSGKEFTKQEVGKVLFSTGFKQTAKAGVFEAVSSDIVSRQARGYEQSIKGTAISAGVGGLTAGLFGGTITRTAVTNPKVSKLVTGIGYITDPYELPGDIVEKRVRKVEQIAFKKTFLEPQVKSTGKNIFTLNVGTVGTMTKKQDNNMKSFKDSLQGKRSKQQGKGFSTFEDLVADVESNNNRNTRNLPFSIFSNANTNTNVPQQTQTKSNDDYINTVNNYKQEYQNNINTNINTNVPSFSTTTNIPTVTPMFRLPPPIPLAFGGGLGGVAPSKGKNIVFFNELAAGRKVLGNLLGVNQTTRRKTNVKKTKIVKRKKK